MGESDNANLISESEESVIESSNSSYEIIIESIEEAPELDSATRAISPITSEQIDISTPAFIGFGVAVAIVFASLGVAVFLKIFKKA